MPSLRLPKLIRRDPDRPTLKQRAAALKATAARVMRRPARLPEPGGEAAMSAWHAACHAHSALTHRLADAYPELQRDVHRGDRTIRECWTKDSLSRALDAGDITVAEFARLHPIASERELRFAVVEHRLNLHALFALGYADSFPASKADDTDRDDDMLPPVSRDLACGLVHHDGTVSFCDVGGAIHRDSVAQWIEFTAQRLYSVAHSEMARQAGNPALVDDAWSVARDKARRELRVDALRILNGRWREAFEAAREAPHLAPDPAAVLAPGNPVLLALVEERLAALDLENSGTLSDDEGDRVHEHGARCFKKACAIPAATPADFLAKWRMAAPELRDAAGALGRLATLAFGSLDADLSGPAAGALFVGVDAELLAVGREFTAAAEREAAAFQHADQVHGTSDYVEASDTAVELEERTADLARRVAELPALTAEGLRLKLQALAFYDPRNEPEAPDFLTEQLIRSLYRDAGVPARG